MISGRAHAIIKRAREALGDTHQTRWSDDVLLSLLSDAQQDLAARALLLKKDITYNILAGKDTYRLPKDFIKLEYGWASNASGDKKTLEVVHYKDGTKFGQSISALPKYVVIGFAESLVIQIYPVPTDVGLSSVDTIDDSVYGRLAKIGETQVDNGIEVSLQADSLHIVDDKNYGLMDITIPTTSFTLHYYFKPAELTSQENELLVPDTCDLGLRYYIIAHALLQDMDSRNTNAASHYMQLYQSELSRHKLDRQTSFMQDSPEAFTIPYRTGFER